MPTGAATLHEFVELLVGAYGTGAMVSFAWTIACIFRDIIFERFKNFPVLNLFGRKGSGKTELARALSSLFYVLPESPHSISNTTIPVIDYCRALSLPGSISPKTRPFSRAAYI